MENCLLKKVTINLRVEERVESQERLIKRYGTLKVTPGVEPFSLDGLDWKGICFSKVFQNGFASIYVVYGEQEIYRIPLKFSKLR